MGFAANVKQRWAMMQLKATSRQKKVVGWERAKKIGILYDATDREAAECVHELVRELRAEQKEVSALGFVNARYEEEIPKSRLGMDFFGPKSLNFSLKSSAVSVANFLGEQFDLLIDLNLDGSPVLLRVTAASRSGFIVGMGDAGRTFRDLYFENLSAPGEPAPRRLHVLIENIKKYTAKL